MKKSLASIIVLALFLARAEALPTEAEPSPSPSAAAAAEPLADSEADSAPDAEPVTGPVPGPAIEASPGERELVEMDDISLVAEPERAADPVKSTSAALADNLPVAGDPFGVVRYEDAVVEDAVLNDSDYALVDTVMGFTRRRRAYSVYGADSDFNAYYFDFIRIPMNKHSESDAPIVSVWAIDRIDAYKGTAPLERGPGIGGAFVAVPDEALQKDRQFIFSPDTSLVNLTWKQRLGDSSGLVLSASKSVSELTTPAMYKFMDWYYGILGMDLIDEAFMVPSFGDLCAHAFFSGDRSTLVVDAIGFYDLVLGGLDLAGRYDVSSDSFPYFIAGGLKLSSLLGERWANEATASVSWQDRRSEMLMDLDIEDYLREALRRMGETEEAIEAAIATMRDTASGSATAFAKPHISVFATEMSEALSYFPAEGLSFTAGLSARYAVIDGTYEGYADMDLSVYGMRLTDHYTVPLTTMAEEALKLHGYVRADAERGALSGSLGAGAAWFPLSATVRPTAEASAAWAPDGDLSLAGRAGWSCAYFDEFAFAERRLNELILGTATSSSYATPPSQAAGSLELAWSLGDARLGLEPYGAFYYDLSGLALYASWKDPYDSGANQDLLAQTSMLDPDIGRSFGATCAWESPLGGGWSARASLTAASTMYRDRGASSWFRGNNDVSGALKAYALYETAKGAEYCVTLNAYAGKPFTPERVNDAGLLEKEAFNSAVDWVPRFSLGANVQWESTFMRKLAGRYEFSCSSLLAFINPELSGMKPESASRVGASTKRFADRRYTWLRTDLLDIFTAMELKFGGTYFF